MDSPFESIEQETSISDQTDDCDTLRTLHQAFPSYDVKKVAVMFNKFKAGKVKGLVITHVSPHLIDAAEDMYKSLERQRTGMINLIDLNLIPESHFESVRHEISLIDNELSRARGE